MQEFSLVGAAVFGVLLFVWFVIDGRREEKRDSLSGVKLPCLKCKAILDARKAWVKSSVRGDLFRCPLCRHPTIWDVTTSPHTLIRK